MSRPIISALIVVATAGLLTPPTSVSATELAVPRIQQADECGPCGCVHVTYDHHRELRSTYGVAFDPRNFDQTQPYYYFGPVRAYPQFWCDGLQSASYIGKGKAPPPVEVAPPPVVTK